MAHRPLVSCIIPAYNAADTIVRAVQSVRRQTYPDIETVVVNDGSTDATEDALRSHFPEVCCIRHAERKGPAAARNAGARAARGTVLALLDADDEWLPVKTEIQLEALRRLSDPGALFTGLLLRTQRWGHRIFPARARVGLTHLTARDILWGRHMPIAPASAMMYASAFSELGGYDERPDVLEEELWVRMAGRGLSLARLELPLYVQHVTAGSLTSDVRWMSDSLLATIALCAPDTERGRAIGMSPDEYARLRRKWLMAGALSLVRAGNPEAARVRLSRELAAGARRRDLRLLLLLATRCPSLLRAMVRARLFPARLYHYLRTRATYWRFARILEANSDNAAELRQLFPRARCL